MRYPSGSRRDRSRTMCRNLPVCNRATCISQRGLYFQNHRQD
jgi:hypothetical protein